MEIIGPASCYFISQRIRLHYVDWGNPTAPPLVLLHGGRDHARSFDWVARELRDRYHVVAPDLRGHGDSAWAIGSNYHMHEYVYDLAQLIDVVAGEEGKVTAVGHSFGGAILSTYASSFPERIEKFVNIEGFGPPEDLAARWSQTPMPEQMRKLGRAAPKNRRANAATVCLDCGCRGAYEEREPVALRGAGRPLDDSRGRPQ